MNLVNFAVR